MPYQVPNWGEYQIYKDRNPAWICLHKKLIDDRKFQEMPDAARALLPMLWLIASENKDYKSGIIDLTTDDIAYRLRRTNKYISDNLKILLTSGFIKDVRNCTNLYENVPIDIDRSETKTETDPRKAGFNFPEWLPMEAWWEFVKFRKQSKSQFTERSAQLALTKLGKLRDAGQDVSAVIDQTIERGYTGLFPVSEAKGAKTDDDVIYRGVKV